MLVSTAFPAGQKYLSFEKDVAVAHPSIVANVVVALRQVIVLRGAPVTNKAEHNRKADQLLQFAKSEEFRRGMKAAAESTAELHRLQTKERQQHDRIWTTQADLFRAIEQEHGAIDARITQIISGVPLSLVQDDDEAAADVG